MRAAQNRAILSSWDETARKIQMAAHKRRLKAMAPAVDLSPPASLDPTKDYGSPIKKVLQSQAVVERIAKDNMLLAQRIFAIMEGPGMISDMMNHSDHLDRHPGTLNFHKRLAEARRIHMENLTFAARLDAMKPYCHSKFENDVVLKLRKKRLHKKNKKSIITKGLKAALQLTRSNQEEDDSGDINLQQSAGRKQHVLLEYTKSQNDRVLDVAVVKEPFRDRYIIFGIDIENGQRYELQLTSEEVSSIVDGDILVTSVDHIEVWMALLRKIELLPVEAFTMLATEASVAKPSQEDGITDNTPNDDDKINQIDKLPIPETSSSVQEIGANEEANCTHEPSSNRNSQEIAVKHVAAPPQGGTNKTNKSPRSNMAKPSAPTTTVSGSAIQANSVVPTSEAPTSTSSEEVIPKEKALNEENKDGLDPESGMVVQSSATAEEANKAITHQANQKVPSKHIAAPPQSSTAKTNKSPRSNMAKPPAEATQTTTKPCQQLPRK